MLNRWARRAFLAGIQRLDQGTLRLTGVAGEHRFGLGAAAAQSSTLSQSSPSLSLSEAVLSVHDERFFWRAISGGDIGLGESYMDGDWSSPDLVTLIRLMLRNLAIVEQSGGLVSSIKRSTANLGRRLRDNSLAGSRRHIRAHYDLGNRFFQLFLDDYLMYSSAYYISGFETLEQAQQNKLDAICRKLDLQPDDHVLEIGTGWGGFAVYAATRFGCRVTTTTISDQQYDHAVAWVAALGDAGLRIEVLKADYRELSGRFDKIVSIEMFEAVGLHHYDAYFGAIDRLLTPDGSMLLQTITVSDQYFPAYHATADWIERYIFPGGELASLGEILRSMTRTGTMSLFHAENIGTHYARTLHTWRDRFLKSLDHTRSMGFDERFIRMWDLYLAYSEAAFLERHAGNFQLLLTKNASRRNLFNEPWDHRCDPLAHSLAV